MLREDDKVWIVPNPGGQLHPAIVIKISKDEQRAIVISGTGTERRDIPCVMVDPVTRVSSL
jgi:hypothetical protein